MSYIDNTGKFNHGKWMRNQLLTEAPMDSGFLKEWEGASKALLNHIDHELKEDAKTGRKNYRELTKLRTAVTEASDVPNRLAAIVGMNENKITEGTKAYELGDMWSNDFDYIGMLKFGAEKGFYELGLDNLQKLFNSFEDVNYHRESQDLGNALDWMEDMKGIEDEEKVKDFLEMFRKKCMSTLDVMGVKWSPRG